MSDNDINSSMPDVNTVVQIAWPRGEHLRPDLPMRRSSIVVPDVDSIDHERMDRIYADMIASGRGDSLAAALLAHPSNFDPASDKRWARLAIALADPKNMTIDFAMMCAKMRISVREIIPYFVDHQRSMAMFRVAEKTPVLADEVMTNALGKESYCEACRAKGYVWEVIIDENTGEPITIATGKTKGRVRRHKVTCIDCNGTGKAIRPANEKIVDKALEMSGLVSKDSKQLVINQNFGGAVLEDTVTDIGRVLNER